MSNVVIDLLEGDIEQDNPNKIYVSIQIEAGRQGRFENVLKNKNIKYYLSQGLYKVNYSEENIKTICRENDIFFSFRDEYRDSE